MADRLAARAEPIRRAMKRAFTACGLPWTRRRSPTAAVLLAMFAGVFGAHHFYLGDRRRGYTRLALFWTIVPTFIGWHDTLKPARHDPRAFDATYPPQQRTSAMDP